MIIPYIFDGGLGTTISALTLDSSLYDGYDCGEILNLTAPEIITDIHYKFLLAGSNVIETNTFSASPFVLNEMGLLNKCEEINRAAVKCAKNAIEKIKDKKCYIAGSIGPGNKLAVLDQVEVDELFLSYKEQISYLLSEGVDFLIFETSQDILQIKSSLAAAITLFKEGYKKVPIMVSMTLENNGTTLTGTPMEAIIATLNGYDEIYSLGVNCGSGPDKMEQYLKILSKESNFKISCLPNQGLPIIKNGKTFYPLSPNDFASYMVDFVKKYGVSVVGGCCGTSYEHIKELTINLKNEGLYE